MRDRKVLTVDVPAAIAKAKQYRDQVGAWRAYLTILDQ